MKEMLAHDLELDILLLSEEERAVVFVLAVEEALPHSVLPFKQ
jgi:hypothetical protein